MCDYYQPPRNPRRVLICRFQITLWEAKNQNRHLQRMLGLWIDLILYMMDDTSIEVGQPIKKEFGCMKVLYRRGTFVVALGPQCKIIRKVDCFFMCAFSFFCLAAFTVLTKVMSLEGFIVLKVLALIACTGQPISYLVTAFTNPGIIISQPNIEMDKSK